MTTSCKTKCVRESNGNHPVNDDSDNELTSKNMCIRRPNDSSTALSDANLDERIEEDHTVPKCIVRTLPAQGSKTNNITETENCAQHNCLPL